MEGLTSNFARRISSRFFSSRGYSLLSSDLAISEIQGIYPWFFTAIQKVGVSILRARWIIPTFYSH
jgi:hypothetical protein